MKVSITEIFQERGLCSGAAGRNREEWLWVNPALGSCVQPVSINHLGGPGSGGEQGRHISTPEGIQVSGWL